MANTKNSKQLICDPQHYTIYEQFQDIEHALDGDELIYELWQNWADNRNDVVYKLKINKEKEIQHQHDHDKAKAKVNIINKILAFIHLESNSSFFCILKNSIENS